MKRRLLLLCATALLAACAGPAPVSSRLPMLRLPPQALARQLNLVQRLSVRRLDQPDAPPQTVDVLFQADAERLQLAGFALNQRVLTLAWDGQHLSVQRHPLLPAEVDVERMLRDISLAWWPATAINAALPEGWSLEQRGDERVLRQQGEARLSLRYAPPNAEDPQGERRIELDNPVEGYALTIESKVQP